MEKKNTVLLTVIAVATLLVAVVGATFAYFTATTAGAGNGTANTSTTTSVGAVKLDLATTANTADIKYPGGMMLNGASVTSTVTGSGSFDATYKINATVDASALGSANSTVKYTLYRTDTEVTGATVSGCTLQTNATDGTTTYSYTGCSVTAGVTAGTQVATGTIDLSGATKTATISESDTTSFKGITSAATKSVYYYLVVEYVNNDAAEQNDDMGKAITATITEITEANAVAAAA